MDREYMEWYVDWNDNDEFFLYEGQQNPQFCLCERYFPHNDRWFGEYIKEVISVDSLLFPAEKQTLLSREQAESIPVPEGRQILCVLCMCDEKGEFDISDPVVAESVPEGFTFCGFDLADRGYGRISPILNCGSFMDGDYFSKAFDYRDLNEFGLIPDYRSAVRISWKLPEEYDDPHAVGIIFGIWRRI